MAEITLQISAREIWSMDSRTQRNERMSYGTKEKDLIVEEDGESLKPGRSVRESLVSPLKLEVKKP